MAERFQVPLPLWKAQFELLGGQKRMFGIASIYLIVLVAGAAAWRRLTGNQPLGSVISSMMIVLSIIQIALLIFGGSNAVYRAALRDYQTRMVESHRLTPMSNLSVMIGLLLGATLQMQTLFLVNVMFGSVLCLFRGSGLDDWLIGNVFLLTCGLLLWSATLFAGMRPAKPLNLVPVLSIAGAAGWIMSFVVPGLGLLIGFYAVIFSFSFLAGSGLGPAPPEAFIIVAAVNVVWSHFWIWAAAAKYRRPDLPAFNASRGLVFLILWQLMAVGAVAGIYKTANNPALSPYSELLSYDRQWLFTLIVSLLMAAVVVSGAVESRRLFLRGTWPRNRWDRVSDRLVAYAAAVLVCGISFAVGFVVWPKLFSVPADAQHLPIWRWTWSWGWTVLAAFSAVWTVRNVARVALARAKSAVFVIVLVLTVLWGLPPAVDYTRAQFQMDSWDDLLQFTWLMGCSPAGTLVMAWSPEAPWIQNPSPAAEFDEAWWTATRWLGVGFLVQLGIGVVVAFLAGRTPRRITAASSALHR